MQPQSQNGKGRGEWNGHSDEVKEVPEEKSTAIMNFQKERINPLVSNLVGQCHALLRQELEKEARRQASSRVIVETRRCMQKALARLSAVAGDMEAAVLERTQDRLFPIVREEIKKVFQDFLADTDGLVDFPEAESQEAPDQTEAGGASAGDGTQSSTARLQLTNGEGPQIAEDAPVPSHDETAPFRSDEASTEISQVEIPGEPRMEEGGGMDRPSSRVTAVTHEDEKREEVKESREQKEDLWHEVVDLAIQPPIALALGMRFQQQIRQSNEMRLLQIVGTQERGTQGQGMTVRVQMDKPVPLLRMLQGMAEVAEVQPVKVVPGGNGGIPRLYLTLRSE